MDPTESDRLARLEREIEILRVEFARLREQIGVTAASAPPPRAKSPPPGSGPPPAESPRTFAKPIALESEPRRSVEEIIGRYGTMAIATVLVLFGVGAFLSWAIRNGLLGPTGRVVFGYAVAAGIAFAGLRIRLRGTRDFGNFLLAMALGVVHLVCWRAGPILHVIPSFLALGIGFLASVMLAEFALRHEEEALCAIGFGGAILAPFIAGDSHGNRIALAVYGVVVVALAAAALGARPWKIARGVAMWGVIIFTLGSGTGAAASSPPQWIATRLWVLTPVIMAAAFIPFTHADHRRSMLRISAGALMLGALFRADKYPADIASLLITLAGTIVIIAALDLTRPGALEREAPTAALDVRWLDRATLLDAFFIPVGLFIATIAAAPRLDSLTSAAVAVAFTVAAIYMTHRTRGEPDSRRYASTASLIALWIVPAAFVDQGLARVAGCTAVGILLMQTAAGLARFPFVAGAGGSFMTASIFAIDWLDHRTRFDYVPFLTLESLGAAIAVAGWVIGARMIARPTVLPELDAKLRGNLREIALSGAALTAFAWGIFEFDGAWNRTAATALLIVYYAAAGSLAIYVGRLRDVAYLRIAGLAVALWAAWKALVEAVGLPNVAVRVTVFFAVAAFLVGIGYWYRRGAEVEPGTSPATSA